MTESLGAFRSFMECHCRLAEKGENSGHKRRAFVTISRQAGAGGITIGRKVAEYLNAHDSGRHCPWMLFDKKLVEVAVEEHGLPKQMAQFMPEDRVSEIRDILDTMFELHPPTFALVKQVSETMLHLAEAGQTIIVGRGGNIVTRTLPGGLHVRLIGSLGRRVKHISEYYGWKTDEASEKVKQLEEGRKNYIKQNFDANIDDALLYDLVINTDHISYDTAAQMIGDAVLARQSLKV